LLSSTGPLLQLVCPAYLGRSPYRLYALSMSARCWRCSATGRHRTALAATASGLAVVGGSCCTRLGRVLRSVGSARGGDASAWPDAAAQPAGLRRTAPLRRPGCAARGLRTPPGSLMCCHDETCLSGRAWSLFSGDPLGLYLLSFVICFDHERLYRRGPGGRGGAHFLTAGKSELPCSTTSAFRRNWCCTLPPFCRCMICHGELVRVRQARDT